MHRLIYKSIYSKMISIAKLSFSKAVFQNFQFNTDMCYSHDSKVHNSSPCKWNWIFNFLTNWIDNFKKTSVLIHNIPNAHGIFAAKWYSRQLWNAIFLDFNSLIYVSCWTVLYNYPIHATESNLCCYIFY